VGREATVKIIIEVIDHANQRYPTCGDYFFDDEGTFHIKVSHTGDSRYNALIAVHELVESVLIAENEIPIQSIDNFDKSFEILREKYPSVIGDMEPGDMTSAPYYREHKFATKIEKLLAEQLGVEWSLYEQRINEL
jgi:hypothetical protein